MKLVAEFFTICAANAISKGSADAECTMQCFRNVYNLLNQMRRSFNFGNFLLLNHIKEMFS